MTALKGDDDYWTSVGGTAGGTGNGRLRYVKEEGGIARPYTRFSFGPTAQSHAFQSNTPVATEVVVHFDHFDDASGSLDLETVQAYLNTKMDSLNTLGLTITGYRAMKFQRGLEIMVKEEDTDFWHQHTEYKSFANPS